MIILLTTLIAAWAPFYRRIKNNTAGEFPIGEALACGVFLGAGLIHMLADANEQFQAIGIDYPMAFLLSGFTFLFLLLLEHIGTEVQHLHHHNNNSSNDSTKAIAILSVFMLSIHSLLAGTALGITSNIVDITVVFIAIIAHKWAASFALAIQINKTNLLLINKIILFAIFASMVPLGIFSGIHIAHVTEHASLLLPTFNALASGTFLYIGTLHGLQRAVMVQKCCNLKEFFFVIIGFCLMAVVALWT